MSRVLVWRAFVTFADGESITQDLYGWDEGVAPHVVRNQWRGVREIAALRLEPLPETGGMF